MMMRSLDTDNRHNPPNGQAQAKWDGYDDFLFDAYTNQDLHDCADPVVSGYCASAAAATAACETDADAAAASRRLDASLAPLHVRHPDAAPLPSHYLGLQKDSPPFAPWYGANGGQAGSGFPSHSVDLNTTCKAHTPNHPHSRSIRRRRTFHFLSKLRRSSPSPPPLTTTKSSLQSLSQPRSLTVYAQNQPLNNHNGTVRPQPSAIQSSPHMEQPIIVQRGRIHDQWAQRLDKSAEYFSLSNINAAPLSPPPSSRIDQIDQWDSFLPPVFSPDEASTPPDMQSYRPSPHYQMTPGRSPSVDSDLYGGRSTPGQMRPSPAFTTASASQPVTTSAGFDSMFWDQGNSGSFNFDFTGSAASTAPMNDSKVAPWWPMDMAPQQHQGQATQPRSHVDVHGQQQQSQHTSPVGVHAMGSYPPQSHTLRRTHSAQHGSYYTTSLPSHTSMPAIPQLPSRPGQPERHHSQPYPSMESMPSHRTPSPHMTGMRRPSTPRSAQMPGQTKKSVTKPYATVGPTSSKHQRSKTMSSIPSSSPSTGSRPQGGAPSSSSGGGAGFVNFTPDDSHKILTGVAPSGSSKTKARREKEAAERRRQLSLAAKRAVLTGDVKGLEGLFV